MDVIFNVKNDLLTDYLKYLFPPDEDGLCPVRSTHPFGSLLIAHCREADGPTASPSNGVNVPLKFPESHSTQDLRSKWLYYTAGDTARLNSALKAVFELDLQGYYLKASGMGFRKKDIVEAFVLSRGLAGIDPYDALHKRIYRREQDNQERVVSYVLRKMNYINETIDLGGLKDNRR